MTEERERQLLDRIRELKQALRVAEWGDSDGAQIRAYCPACGQKRTPEPGDYDYEEYFGPNPDPLPEWVGHAKECPIALALRPMAGEP